jgi:TP901 family phage tail tape measure protein
MPVASELLVKIRADGADQVDRELNRVDGSVNRVAKGATALGAVGAAAFAGMAVAAVGLGAGLVSSIRGAMGFEAAIDNVGALANASEGEIAALSEAAIKLGQDTRLSGIGATDAAAAMAELAAAGFTVAEMTGGVTEGVLLLASATGTDVARAAEIAGDSFNVFRKAMGLTAQDMPMIANLFTGAANVSSIGLEDIGAAMNNIGPIAAAMGLSIQETTAAIAALGNQGIKGGEAGTALRGILASLADPSKESAKLIKELGLNFRDSNGQMKDFGGIAEELRDKLGGLTNAQREQVLAQLFGREGLAAINALYGEGAEGIAKYMESINAQGNAAAIGAKRNDNLKGAIEALGSSWETAQIALGTAFLPALKELVDLTARAVSGSIPMIQAYGPQLAAALSAGLGAVPGLVARARDAIVGLVGAVRALAAGDINGMFGPILAAIEAAFGPAAMARAAGGVNTFLLVLDQLRGILAQARDLFAQLPQPVQGLIAGFLALGPAVRVVGIALPLLVGALTGLGPIVGFLTSTIPVLGTVIAALGWPITLLVAAVAALGVAWATNFMGIRDQTMPIIAQIGALITGVLLPALAQIGTYLLTVVWPQVQAAWAQIQSAVAAALAVIVPALTQMGDATIAAFNAALPGIMAFIAGMQQLGAAVLPIVQALAAQIVSSLGPAMESLRAWAAEVIPQFADAWSNVASIVGPIVSALASTIGAALSAIAGFVQAHGAQIQAILQGAWQAMSSMIGAVLTVITGLISSALLLIAGDWRGAWDRMVQTVTTASGQMQSAISGLMSAAINLLAIGFQTMVAAAQSAWAALVAGAQSAMAQMVSAVASGVGQLPGVVMGVAGALFGAGAALINSLIAGIQSRIGAAIQIVRDGIQQIADLMPGSEPKDPTSPLRGLDERGAAIFGNLADGIRSGSPEAVKAAADAASAVAKAITDTLVAMRALAEFDFEAHSPTADAMGWFRHLTESLIATMQEAASAFEDKALEHVGKFADAAGKVGGSVKNALEGLTALATASWADISPTGSAMAWFTHLVASLVQNFATAAQQFETGALEAGGKFAEAAGKVVGVIGPAIDGFAKLATFAAPSETAISQLVEGIRSIVRKFAEMATMMDSEGTKATGEFAEAAGKALGAANTGVQLFAAMAGDKDKAGNNVPVGIPSATAIDQLMEGIKYVVRKFAEMATMIEKEGLAQLQAFASAAGQSLTAVKTGTDLFKQMEKLAVPSEEAINYLLGTIGSIITKIRLIANGIGTEGLREAQAFGAGAFNVISTLAASLKLFEEISKFKDIPGKELEDMHTALEDALDWAHKLFLRAEAIKAEAAAYANSMKEAARLFTEGQSIANGMGAVPVAPTGGGWEMIPMPALASGGIVTKPTVALIGERGPEAVVPLSRYQRGGGAGVSINFYGDVLTSADFDRRIQQAKDTLSRQGRW